MPRSRKKVARSSNSGPKMRTPQIRMKTGSEIWDALLADPRSHELLEEMVAQALIEIAEGNCYKNRGFG